MKNPVPSDANIHSSRPRKRWLAIALSILCLIGVIVFLDSAEDSIDVQPSQRPPELPVVSVFSVEVAPANAEITAYAEIRPRWSATLRAAVSGRITQVFPHALAGEPVTVGTPLISVERSAYVAEVAAAELAVKEAKLALSRSEKATQVARQQFKRGGTQPPNDLALHLPQLRIAKAAVKSARARLKASEKKLENTTLKAPFSGFVTERLVSPGQSVHTGDALLKLVDNTAFEVTVELERHQWQLLRQPLAGGRARLLNQGGEFVASAMIRRGGGFLDDKTRQYKIFLDLQQSEDSSILSGDYVRVLLPGITIAQTLTLPTSSLTQEGHVWYVDVNNRLQKHVADVLFRRQEQVVIKAPEGDDTWRVALTPLLSFLPGQPVQPLHQATLGEL